MNAASDRYTWLAARVGGWVDPEVPANDCPGLADFFARFAPMHGEPVASAPLPRGYRTCTAHTAVATSVTSSPTIERWLRRHIIGWRAEAIRDEQGHWWAAAHRAAEGGTFSSVGDLASAKAAAESRIPAHRCSPDSCGPWIRNGAAGEAWITADHIARVQASFAKVASSADAVGARFYERLFQIDPSLRPLFKGNMAEQGRRLLTMIERAVQRLDCADELLGVVQALGVRHAAYGVHETHYDSFGAALLWTLAHELGPDFTADVQDAWVATYSLLADVMKESAAAGT